MLQMRRKPAQADSPPPGELAAAAQRVMGSETLGRSPRLRLFLSFIVSCAEENRVHEINEYSIGVQVFGKPPSFKPQEDNIVRVTARQLRAKLEEYYRGEGATQPWRIEIPKGTYVPELRPNSALRKPWKAPGRPLVWLLAALALAGWTAAWTGWSRPSVREERVYLFAPLFDSRRLPVLLVADDPLLPLSWQHLPFFPSLQDFLRGWHHNALNYPDASRANHPIVSGNTVVPKGTLELFGRLQRNALAKSVELRIVSWRDAAPEQFSRGHVIFAGGIGGNPWVAAFQKEMAFEQRVDPPSNRRYFVNRNPQSGEPKEYVTGGSGSSPNLYARVALRPNPYSPGWVVLVGGTSRESTEGGWRFAMSESGMRQVRTRCPDPARGFEAILETSTLGTTPMTWKLQTVRCGGAK